MIIYNVAGEAFAPTEDAVTDYDYVAQIEKHARFVGSPVTEGLILMIDPYTCYPVRENRSVSLPKQPMEDNAPDYNFSPENILRIITTYINMNLPASRTGTKPFHVALVLTKLDVFLSDDSDPTIRKTAQQYKDLCEEHRPDLIDAIIDDGYSGVDQLVMQTHSTALKLFEALQIDDLYYEAADHFAQVRCFAVSALGHTPTMRDFEYDIAPIAVELPFLWLFHKVTPHGT